MHLGLSHGVTFNILQWIVLVLRRLNVSILIKKAVNLLPIYFWIVVIFTFWNTRSLILLGHLSLSLWSFWFNLLSFWWLFLNKIAALNIFDSLVKDDVFVIMNGNIFIDLQSWWTVLPAFSLWRNLDISFFHWKYWYIITLYFLTRSRLFMHNTEDVFVRRAFFLVIYYGKFLFHTII